MEIFAIQSLVPICICRLNRLGKDNGRQYIYRSIRFVFICGGREDNSKYRRNNKTLWSITTQFFAFVTDNSIKLRRNLGSFRFYGSKNSFWIFKPNSLWRHAVTLPTSAVSHHQLSPRNSPKTVYSYPTLKPPSFYRNMAPIHDEVLHLQTPWYWYSSTMKFYVVFKLWHKITKLRSKIGTAGTCTGADFNQMVSWLSWGMGIIFLELTITLKTKKLWFSKFFKKFVCRSFLFFLT